VNFWKKDLFEFFVYIVLIEGLAKIKKRRVWPYFYHIVLIEGVLIDANHSNYFFIYYFHSSGFLEEKVENDVLPDLDYNP
jgi:hypothetical protein